MNDSTIDVEAIWERTLQILRRDETVSPRVMALLTLSRLMAVVADTALLAAPSTSAKELFEHRIVDSLKQALSEASGREMRFAVTVDESLLLEGDDDEMPSSAMTSRSSAPGAQSVDNSVDSSTGSVHNSGSDGGFTRADGTSSTTDAEQDRSGIGPSAGSSFGAPSPAGPGASPTEPARPAGGARPAGSSSAAEPTPGPGRSLWSPATAGSPSPAPSQVSSQQAPPAETTLVGDSRLNGKYTFDTFVIGSSNRFAQAACSAVAETPAKAYNPLFIYGGSGLGKTHLLHAIGHYAQSLYPEVVVRYVNSEEFTNDFINSVQSGQFGKAQEFQRRYRDIDILLIDDIQFLQRAPETMEAFFHTFNTLYNSDKQIVITSDLAPKELGGFEDRMRSRFEMGLMTDVQPPDLETRIAILRKKVAQENTGEVPHDVLEYIASHIATNIRELEGALIRVQALHSLSRQPMDVTLAQSVLKDLLSHDDGTQITASTIIAQTATYFGLSVEEIIGSGRSRRLVSARQIAMYLCRELTDMPLIRIGEEFGGRDHTTVMHANKKISELMKERRAIFNQVTELTARIKSSNSTPRH
ncbi:chromosomal replication initiator protein DnaA [Brachybacterium muris]|uniref:Chromosomal replication initiator protein DnaA n=2 Tax=Brachybacterium TaxID=43668 RepID=A0A022KW10_9MICO|nr:chromosomal replication initiator protein DnaA [Brachybacterium muris]EYT48952.1 chromosomal replication initiation protein [Brachybacterium muris UCD-AY4]MCT1653295.1 chromosomal replication initiator protein DnaA [Brachybacterium muris]MCT2176545.1 chromosomal replication initiator protein DnaA [Brachybacterium muris]